MNKFNIIIVYHHKGNKILMCKREKEPYKGLFNFVGGRIEKNEEDIESAYRELEEETGITKDDIELTHLMTEYYMLDDLELQSYVGILNKEITLVEEVNELHWMDESNDFFDMTKYAGKGNTGHLIEQIKYHKKTLFKK